MVFLHGTVIMHRNAVNKGRRERVLQVIQKEESVKDYATYVPVGNAVSKLQSWIRQGAEILYLSPHKSIDKIQLDKSILSNYYFPAGRILFRDKGQTYAEIAQAQMPDILIEDNCESIGGKDQMTYTSINHNSSNKIKSIIVHEFGGVDHLPDQLNELMESQNE